MIILEPFCFCTNNVPGNDLLHALDIAKACGFRHVELSAIDGISEQINADGYSPAYVRRIQAELDQRGLTCYAVSGHCDMTDELQFRRLLKKIRFAADIGAKYLNTRCGPKDRYPIFLEHIKEAAELAISRGITINLESYGDIVGPASECGPVFETLNLENVQYNYDAGNTFRYARGDICIHEDLQAATKQPSYLHMKDTSIRDGWIYNDPIGAGALDIPNILAALEHHSPVIPCSLELPMGFRVRLSDLSFDFLSPSDDEVCQAVTQSVSYLQTCAAIQL